MCCHFDRSIVPELHVYFLMKGNVSIVVITLFGNKFLMRL